MSKARPGYLDLLTLKVVSESRVTWATSVPILVFLGLSVPDLSPMYATDRRQTAASLNAPTCKGRGHNNVDGFNDVITCNDWLMFLLQKKINDPEILQSVTLARYC